MTIQRKKPVRYGEGGDESRQKEAQEKWRKSRGKDGMEREVVTVAEEVKHMDLRADWENMSGEER